LGIVLLIDLFIYLIIINLTIFNTISILKSHNIVKVKLTNQLVKQYPNVQNISNFKNSVKRTNRMYDEESDLNSSNTNYKEDILNNNILDKK
jgi:hypothetical protein